MLKKIKQFPSKEFFDEKLLSVDEASENWLIAQKKIKDRKKICFLKTHNVNGAFKGNSFTTTEFTAGAIYIVRDPRNVVTSLAHNFDVKIEDAYEKLKNNSVFGNIENVPPSYVGSWGFNYISCLLYTSPSPRDLSTSRMPSSA